MERVDFRQRIEPPSHRQILQQEGYFIWCGSVVKDEKGMYHMFASRWSKELGFKGWLTDSEIVRAVSRFPEGPYNIVEELGVLKRQAWCSKMVHNPMVLKYEDTYYLYYLGTTFREEEREEIYKNRMNPARLSQRIGVARAPSPEGPWELCLENPVLEPREGKWDSTFVTNPSVFAGEDKKIYMIYKSRLKEEERLNLGLATAEQPFGAFCSVSDEPFFSYHVEDPYVWYEDGCYRMLAKAMSDELVENHNGILFESEDLKCWKLSEHPLAWDRFISWTDGVPERVPNMERPMLLLENGVPVCLYNAVGDFSTWSYNLARRIMPKE